LEDCSRRSLTRFARSMISRHSAALWRLLGCTRHEPLLPLYGHVRLLWSPWPPIAAAMTRAVDRGFSWPWPFFFFLPSRGTAPEPPVWAAPVCGAECMPNLRRLWRTCRPERGVWRQSPRHAWPTSPTFFITYSLTEGRDDGCIGNARYSASHLGEAGDKRPESLPGFLPHCVEVGLHAVLLVSAGEVRCEPRAELFPGID
jgi:hypothetical protein